MEARETLRVSRQRWLVFLGLLLLLFGAHARAATPELVTSDMTVCLKKADSTVSCWGYNGDGQASPPPGAFSQISIGAWSACGVRPDSSAVCWGQAANGMLEVPDMDFAQVDAGDYFHCGIRLPDRKVVCWGTQVGGVYIPYTTDEDHFTKVSTGYTTFCAIRTSGELACGGLGYMPPAPEGTFSDVVAGIDNVCAVRTDGAVVCWGSDAYGISTQTPAGAFVSAAPGRYHACALRQDQTIACWGYLGSQDYRQYFPPAGTFSAIAVGGHANCALRTDGVVQCWGLNAWGEAPEVALNPKHILAAQVGVPYSASLSMFDKGSQWTVGPYIPVDAAFALDSGTLPAGFVLNPQGLLEGTAAAAGEWPVTVRARDSNGFEAVRDIVFTVVPAGDDVTPPTITPSLNGFNEMGDWYRTDVELTWLVEDPESGSTSQVGCDPTTINTDTPRPGASYTCVARSTGGVSDETVELRRDATPPTIQITDVHQLTEEEGYPEGYFRIQFSASDVTSQLHYTQCGLDGAWGSFCDGLYHEVVGPLEPGAHSFQVRAWDNAGNVSAAQTATLTTGPVDTSPPVITPTITGTLGPNGWYTSDVQVSWSVTDAESAMDSTSGCDASSVTADTSGVTFVCQGSSGGGSSQQSVTVKRDASPPDSLVTSGPSDPSDVGVAAVLRFAGTDPVAGVAGFWCSLDGAAFALCSTPMRYNRLPAGTHTFRVRAFDFAGNNDATPAVHTWQVRSTSDLSPPVAAPAAARAPNQYGWYRTDVAVIWNWSDTGTGINTNSCTRRTTATGEGILLVEATCTDLAGNVGHASFQVKMDRTPPILAPSVSPATVLLNGSATATANATDALSGVATQTCAAVNTSSVNRTYTTCEATDQAGNRRAAIRAEYRVVYKLTWVAPIAEPPTVNVAPTRSFMVPFRFRLSDANNVPVSNVRLTQLQLAVVGGACTGASNVLATPSAYRGVRNLGGGLYEFPYATSLGSGCFQIIIGDQVEFKPVLARWP